MSDMFKAEIKSFMADTKITQEQWDKIFGKKEDDIKEEIGTPQQEVEKFQRWWETVVDDIADANVVPLNENIIRRVPKK